MSDNQDIYGELKAASYLALDHYPDTKEAVEFCRTITIDILQQEDRKRQRKPDDQIKFNAAAQYIISELIAANDENQRGWLFRSLRRETFSASPVKADTFRHVVNGLERLDYIEIIKGRNHRNPFYEPGQIEYVPGLATRFRATLKLIKRATLAGFEVNQYKRHFNIKPNLQHVLEHRFHVPFALGTSVMP